jgi:hypothetical protein
LRFFPLRRSRKSNHTENARAHSCSYSFDGSAFAGSIAAFKQDADFLSFVPNPFLQFDELRVKALELMLILLAFELTFGRRYFVEVYVNAAIFFHYRPQSN